MTTTSARPELLHGYATAVDALAGRVDAAHDLAQRAAAAYAAACPGYPVGSPSVAATVADQTRDLALGTDQVGWAFARADRGSIPTTGPAGVAASAAPRDRLLVIEPSALSQEIIASYPGLADADLARPGLELPGREAARALLAGDLDDRLATLAELDTALDDGELNPSFAAGLIDELGATGLTGVIDQITLRYEDARLSINRADDAIATVAHLLAAAGDQVDLGIISSMGRTQAGRNAIRELSIGSANLFDPSLIAAMATQTLIRHSAEDDGYGRGSSWNLLHHRLDLHAELARPDLPLLEALAKDPEAAWAWERSGTRGVSPLALNMSRGGAGEPEAVADLLEAMLITPVEDGTLDAYRSAFEGSNRTAPERELKDTIDAVLRSGWAVEVEGKVALSNLRLQEVHPEAYHHRSAIDDYKEPPDDEDVRLYEGQTAEPAMRRRAIDLAVETFAAEATKAVGQASPTGAAANAASGTSSTDDEVARDADPDALLTDLDAVHADSKALQAAAHKAGEHRNSAAAGVVAATKVVASKAAQAAVAAAAAAMGPEGALAAAVGTRVAKESLSCLAEEADAPGSLPTRTGTTRWLRPPSRASPTTSPGPWPPTRPGRRSWCTPRRSTGSMWSAPAPTGSRSCAGSSTSPTGCGSPCMPSWKPTLETNSPPIRGAEPSVPGHPYRLETMGPRSTIASSAPPTPQHRSHRRTRTALATSVAVVGALFLAGCWSPAQGSDMDLVNSYRRSMGKTAVAGDVAAMNKAQAWSAHMAATGVMEHTGGGTQVDTRGVTGWCSYYENVGYGTSVAAVHNSFRNSTQHRNNMLSPSHRIGTGVVQKGNLFWVTEIYLRNC